jgi:hypothetical protein
MQSNHGHPCPWTKRPCPKTITLIHRVTELWSPFSKEQLPLSKEHDQIVVAFLEISWSHCDCLCPKNMIKLWLPLSKEHDQIVVAFVQRTWSNCGYPCLENMIELWSPLFNNDHPSPRVIAPYPRSNHPCREVTSPILGATTLFSKASSPIQRTQANCNHPCLESTTKLRSPVSK